MQSRVPDGHDEFAVPNGQRAGKMYVVGPPPKCVETSEMAGVPLNFRSQLDWPGGAPVFLPRLFGCGQVVLVDVMVTTSSRKRGTNLGMSEAARQGGVATIPYVSD
jgi:hypothetical protein